MQRVLIGEFGPILRLGLHEMLVEEGCDVVGEETSGLPVLDRLVESLPAVVLIDMDAASFPDLVETISREYPAIKLIGISSVTPSMRVFIPFHHGEFYTTGLSPDQLMQVVAER